MIVEIGKIIGLLFNVTGNLGFTVMITAIVVSLIKNIASVIFKEQRQNNCSTFKDMRHELKNRNLPAGITQKKDAAYYIYTVLYTFFALAVFIVIANAAEYIPGVDADMAYPFLFFKDILHNDAAYLPTLCGVFVMVSGNIFHLKETFITHFAKTALKLAFLILMLSLGTFAFGQIYLIYIMTRSLFSIIFKLVINHK